MMRLAWTSGQIKGSSRYGSIPGNIMLMVSPKLVMLLSD